MSQVNAHDDDGNNRAIKEIGRIIPSLDIHPLNLCGHRGILSLLFWPLRNRNNLYPPSPFRAFLLYWHCQPAFRIKKSRCELHLAENP